jgi:hypothetical protein
MEYDAIMTTAKLLYDKKDIPTAGTYSRAAALKINKELNNLIAKEKEEEKLTR